MKKTDSCYFELRSAAGRLWFLQQQLYGCKRKHRSLRELLPHRKPRPSAVRTAQPISSSATALRKPTPPIWMQLFPQSRP